MEVRVQQAAFTAVTFPKDDWVFAERVRQAIRDSVGGFDDSLEILWRRLGPVYPELAIRVRSGLAGFGPGLVAYVFRDGTPLPRLDGETWIADEGTPRVITDTDGTYVDANEAAAALFGVGREEILGKRAGTFTKPDARIEHAAELWRALTETGRLHSLAVVRRSDGTDVPVEFVTVHAAAGPDRNLTYLRRIERG